MSNQNYVDTIAALKAIIVESLKNPEKRKEFVSEGSVELIIGLCDIRSIPWSLGVYCAAALRILAHDDSRVKAKIVGRGGLSNVLKMCEPKTQSDDIDTIEDVQWRYLAHEQAAAVLHMLSYQNPTIQSEMVSCGAIKHLVKLCDMFDPMGCHSNCCYSVYQCSKDANQLLHDLTFQKKLVGKVKELSLDALREKAVNLVRTGLVSGSTEVNKIYSIDLYDTTTDYQDIRISDELINSQLMWPDMIMSNADDSEDEGKYVKHKDGERWADICVTQVIDACHFWAHVGGKLVVEKVEAINRKLLSQVKIPLTCIPEPGTFVCVSEIFGGHKDSYRAQVLSTEHSADGSFRAHVFALDNGFTTEVFGNCLHVLPEELLDIAPQVTLCCLSGIQAPPKNAEVLEHVAGVLRNLTQENNSHRLYVAAQSGLELLIKLCTIPNRNVCKQAAGAIVNLAINTKVQVRIGFLGGIRVLLDVCRRFAGDEELLLLAIGGIQNLVRDSYVNRCRLADSDGLIILGQLYFACESDAIKERCLEAIKNLLGNSITTLENGILEVNEISVPVRRSYDARSVIDEKKKFSLSVSDDEAPFRRRRRRRRLRKGEVEPKPTLVALSRDSGKRSSTGESDGFTDNEYSYTDDDTDGERLLTANKPPLVTRSADDTDVDVERYYVRGYHVPFSEDDLHDFRPQSNIHNVSSRVVERSLCAFLNSGKCGTVYLGIRKDGVVCGVNVGRKERDQLRLGVDECMDRFNPSVKHHIYEVHFIPVVRSDSPTLRVQVEERFVVEIKIVNCPGLVYMTPNGKCYFRQKSRNEEFTTQEVREKTIKEQETLYNAEMNSLRMELEEMKRQLHDKSKSTEKASTIITPQGSGISLTRDEQQEYRNEESNSRIPGTAVIADSPVEPKLDDLQDPANCVIS